MTKQARNVLPRLSVTAAAVAGVMSFGYSHAFEFNTEDPGLKIRWDNTLKYSTIYRLDNPDAGQLAAYQGSPAGDGDRNFKKGIASNRIDWLTEFDVVKDNNIGGRISATGWYDNVYERNNDNATGLSHNISVGANQFNSETKKAVGNDLRLMDAFVFFKGNLGEAPASVRLPVRRIRRRGSSGAG